MWECSWSLKVQRHWTPGAGVIGSCKLPTMMLGTELYPLRVSMYSTPLQALISTFLTRRRFSKISLPRSGMSPLELE